MSKIYFSALIKTHKEASFVCDKIKSFYPAEKISEDLESWLHNELNVGTLYSGFGRCVSLVYDDGFIDWGIPDETTGMCERGIELVSLNTFLTRTIKNYIQL